MKRHVDMADISDGRLYDSNAMVKAGCSLVFGETAELMGSEDILKHLCVNER